MIGLLEANRERLPPETDQSKPARGARLMWKHQIQRYRWMLEECDDLAAFTQEVIREFGLN